ncbi:MAG TPA: putative peptide modification system cyclase [Dokdonella sp.]|uniref:putative peptide modification system cyclase n=1 Tax=Dokdonella sp. TaxID=2291710 RepID=UPI002C1456C2|nr:putative peptide modification system cyclase [Dokdonella sp.]HNV08408.1 putative peptide modification system cyclase [Dokdonella sp.]
MEFPVTAGAAASTHASTEAHASSMLRTLLLCDLVDSTALVESLGDLLAAELIRKHDRLARTLADRHAGREIDKTDGFMMMFERPVQAVAFALDYQRGLRQLNAAESTSLSARVGIHVGDVVVWDNNAEDVAKGAKPTEVEGLVKPITSRLMNLALPGQILLSNIAYALAHRAQGELGEQLDKLRWRTHGRYRFRGVPDPVPVFEVGEEGLAPLKAPPWSSKAHREVPFWRRPATMVIELVVLAALIGVPIFMFLRPDPAIAFAKRDWVVMGSLNNLTGETVFNDALESALRIGLEQSQYVNVLPDLKVRESVKRMQLDPATTEVSREIGSEIAIRDGARALILPTIAEIGGRVRITAEVIDPQTQTTVYSETADGVGKESILPSLDAINKRLRVRLGEALATVTEESQPLEKVATANLDALRAYSLGYKETSLGDFDQAGILYQHAITLDPDFARARIELGMLYLNLDRNREAQQQLTRALELGERLTPTDKLLAEASMSRLKSPRVALEKWRALATLEPDLFTAQGNYAFLLWTQSNDFAAAIEVTKRNTVEQNPYRGTGHYLLGTLYLGSEDYAQAEQQFEKSAALGTRFQNHMYASVFAARRNFKRAHELLEAGRVSTNSSDKFQDQLLAMGMAADEGNWTAALSPAEQSHPGNSSLDESDASMLADAGMALKLAVGTRDGRKDLLGQLGTGAAPSESSQPSAREAQILFRAWLLAYYGDVKAAKQRLEQLAEPARGGDYPALSKLRALVEATVAARQGQTDKAAQNLKSMLDGTEYFGTHLLLMEMHAERKDFAAALNEARWIAAHRGRAYASTAAGDSFMPFNVLQTNLAQLHIAENALALGKADIARDALGVVRANWKEKDLPDSLSAWMKRLDAASGEKAAEPSARN